MSLDEWMAREKRSDAWLAHEVGVSRPFITRIRAGTRQPSLPVAVKLAEKTKLPISTFIRDAA